MHTETGHKASESHLKTWQLDLHIFKALHYAGGEDCDAKDCLEDEGRHRLSHQVNHVLVLSEFQLLHQVSMLF